MSQPVIVLIPGMLNDASVWRDVAAALQPRAQVRALSVLTQDSIPAMAQAIWQQLADVPVAQPLLLCGFSLGGYVALEMLAQPQRPLAGAALVSTSARPESAEGRVTREKTMAAMQADFAKVVDGVLKWGTHEPSAELLQRLRTMMLTVGAQTASTQTRAIMDRADHRAALAQLQLPLAVVCGRQDRITPPALSEELAALLPGASLTWVEGSGHLLPAEQPRALADALQGLLERAGA